ncbi:unnamed protein product [Ambrosiozyma monospora]|uniref:Unnamed protein product n=1 Tax=Ambrosiozyma monospora TaxID=43982 RepID=A0A9W6YVX8_AMBMO|nr:unnamed protein product [Ambrosiozyma monospora]
MGSRFAQQFANFALSKSNTRMYKLTTNTERPFPLAEKLMESTFEQTISDFHHSFRASPDFRAPAFELCSTLILSVESIEHLCRSGLLTRSNRLKILKLSSSFDEEYLLNKFTKEIRNWFNVNPRNKTDKSLILHLQIHRSAPIGDDFEIVTFLKNTKDLNVKFDLSLQLVRADDLFKGINTLLTQWHEKFNGSLIFVGDMSKELYDSPTFTQFIDTVSSLKIKTFDLFCPHGRDVGFYSIDGLFQYSVSTVVNLELQCVSISNLQNMPSLKRLFLNLCKLIGNDVLSGICEFCDELTLYGCQYEYDDNADSITLPTSIRLLDISENFEGTEEVSDLPKFSNLGKLQRLRTVKVAMLTHDIIATDEETRMYGISRLERFVAQLPSTVESLFLKAYKSIRHNNAFFHPEKLRFDNLPQLHVLFLLIDSNPLSTIPFNFSNVPNSLQKLTIDMPSLFSGKLPKSLQSIDINTRACEKFKEYETFADFWNEWIAPLENLLYFRATNEHIPTIDSGALEFPPNLQVFDIISSSFEKISLVDGLPNSILAFTAQRDESKFYDVDFKLVPVFVCNELQLEELKKQINFIHSSPPWYEFIFREKKQK